MNFLGISGLYWLSDRRSWRRRRKPVRRIRELTLKHVLTFIESHTTYWLSGLPQAATDFESKVAAEGCVSVSWSERTRSEEILTLGDMGKRYWLCKRQRSSKKNTNFTICREPCVNPFSGFLSWAVRDLSTNFLSYSSCWIILLNQPATNHLLTLRVLIIYWLSVEQN